MCFELNAKSKELIAKRDIVCYKLLVERQDGTITSPFLQTDYKLNYLHYADSELQDKFKFEVYKSPYNSDHLGSIAQGLHTYRRFKSGYEDYKYENHLRYDIPMSKRFVHIKCVIPKGAKYYKNKTEYVSDRLFVKEECSHNSLVTFLKYIFK